MGPAIPGRIPWSVVAAWCDVHGYGEADAELFDAVMGELDGVFIADYNSRLPKGGGKGERG